MDDRMERLLLQAQEASADDGRILGCMVLAEAMFDLFRENHGSLTWYGLKAELEIRLSKCGDSDLLKSALSSALDAMTKHRPL